MTPRILPRRVPKTLLATVRAVLADLPDASGDWSLHEVRATSTGTAVVKAGPSGGDPEVVVKVATVPVVGAQLRRHWEAVRALRADPRLGPWAPFVPAILTAGEVDGLSYVVERAFRGTPAASWMADDVHHGEIVTEALSAISGLHRATASPTVVDDAVLDRWVTIPLESLRRLGRPSPALERIGGALREFLLGRSVEVGWVHGDYWPGNVLIDEASMAPCGVVDWEFAADGELPAHDVFHFLLFTRRMRERTDLGMVVRDLLRGRSMVASEREQLEQAVPGGDPEWFRTVLLLYWLRHLAAHLGQPATSTSRWFWARRNVTPVLGVA